MSGISIDKKQFRKYLPGFFLAVLTLTLMFYFKENRGDIGEIVSKGTNDLVSLYTENLEPLLFGTDITNEDVFNFALYQTLPIDKNENKVLKISEENGNTNYEVIPNSYKPDTKNYKNFVKYMAFNNEQSAQLDSILDSYQTELAEAVFTDGQNTYAVNSRLGALQKAVLTDIAAFSRDANKPKLSSLFGKDFAFVDSKQAISLIDEIKRDTTREFLIFSEDTAFTSRLEFNTDDLEKELEIEKNKRTVPSDFKVVAKNKVPPNILLPKPPKLNEEVGKVKSYGYTIPNFELNDVGLNKKAMDSLRISLEVLNEELRNISFNFDLDSLQKKFKFDLQTSDEDSLHSLSFEFNFDNLGEIINKSVESAMSGEQSEEYWENFGMQIDSLANSMVKSKVDSLKLDEETLKKLERLKKLEKKKNK